MRFATGPSLMDANTLDPHHDAARLRALAADVHLSLLSMEQLAHTASHDLRTPLNTLSGLIQLFGTKFEADLPAAAQEYLSYMGRAVQQMDDLTTRFQEDARRACADVPRQPVDLHDALLALRAEVTRARLTVIGTPFFVTAQPDLLRMLLSTLVTDALNAPHPAGPVTLQLILHRQDGVRHLTLRDRREGFDLATFHAALRTTATGKLATCARICRHHGWDFSAETTDAGGAAHTISFDP